MARRRYTVVCTHHTPRVKYPYPEATAAERARSIAYAKARVRATGKPYIVTGMGHAMMQAGNTKSARRELGGIAVVCKVRR